jgi:Strictosidine synthase
MILDPLLDLFRGKAVTIPPMDGALRPNTALDDAKIVTSCDAPDNITLAVEHLFYSSGTKLYTTASAKPIASISSSITAIAACGAVLAIGLESGRIAFHNSNIAALEGFNCPTAVAFDGPNNLYICNGSESHRPSEWASDLMKKNASGSLWHVSLATGQRHCLAKSLAFPYGLIVDAENNRLVISESWKHRLVAVSLQGGKPTIVLPNLAGYPSRLSASLSGGYVLSLFAPRNRLIEFVLLEDNYRNAMLSEIDSRYWIAPSLSSSRSFLEPLQSGGVKTMGIHKPWSPSRSYGLVAMLDKNFEPVTSYHSRANGTRHGITSAIEHKGKIIATSRGGNVILEVTTEAASS